MAGEFELIEHYFSRHKRSDSAEILQSVGDDCALVQLAPNERLAITTDTLAVGTHFLPSIAPADLAHKAVAVNLSDLAAMGATPRWISLALTLPEVNPTWLEPFSQSLFEILERYHVRLIGGDTTRGALSITITAHGTLPQGDGLFRHQAKAGDWIFVSNTLGDSAAGLELLLTEEAETENAAQQFLLRRHLRPTPQVELGQFLRKYSCCAIDLSDGLLADLGHILKASRVGAELYLENLPLSTELLNIFGLEQAWQFALTGGENYELCFSVPPHLRAEFEQAVKKQGFFVSCIGKITQAQGIRLFADGQPVELPSQSGFDHFQ